MSDHRLPPQTLSRSFTPHPLFSPVSYPDGTLTSVKPAVASDPSTDLLGPELGGRGSYRVGPHSGRSRRETPKKSSFDERGDTARGDVSHTT